MSKSTTEISPKVKESHSRLLNSAMSMGAGTLASRVLGFVRDIALVGLFPQLLTDSFVLGFRIPNFFRPLYPNKCSTVARVPFNT